MENIGLVEFVAPEKFSNLHDIVKQNVEKDSAWEEDISHISSMAPGYVNKFMEHPIKALIVLHYLSVKLIRYRE
jgi:hypothetical protein